MGTMIHEQRTLEKFEQNTEEALQSQLAFKSEDDPIKGDSNSNKKGQTLKSVEDCAKNSRSNERQCHKIEA